MAASLQVVEDGFNLPQGDFGKEEGSEFGWFDRLLFGWRDGMVFDYGDWEARDLYEMMKKDYVSIQLEKVMTLPILSAQHTIIASKGDKGEEEWLNTFWETDHLSGGCKTPLDHILQQMTGAITYKKAFFEKVWTRGTGDFEGKVVYDKVAHRPQTTCRVMREPKHGEFRGFEQEAYYVGPEITKGHWPIQIPAKRAFVYIHGLRRDPLNGTSDMEVAYWAWKTKQKILFLWFQFLEAVSLPRVAVLAEDLGVAQQVAGQLAKLKSSGVIPIAHSGNPDSVKIEPMDISGKGSEEFRAAISWLEGCARDSVLAGFLSLTGASSGRLGAAGMGGSYALSKDASDYFEQSLESKTNEMAFSIRKDLFAPLVRANFGNNASIPHLKFEPLNDIDKETSVSLFQAFAAAPPNPTIPDEFISMLAKQVSDYIGLDGDVVKKAFDEAAKKAKAQAALMGANPQGQAVAGVAGATQAATQAVQSGKLVDNPFDPGGPQIPEPQ